MDPDAQTQVANEATTQSTMDSDEKSGPPSVSEALPTCRVCLEPIRSGARKCIQCDSYQDWRRFLVLSNTVLALLVALVSVSASAIPELITLFSADYSSVSAESHGVKGYQMEFIVNNVGTKEAFALGSVMRATFAGVIKEVSLEELGPTFPISPKQFRTLQVFVPPYFVSDFLSWPKTQPESVVIELRIQEYGGEVKSHVFSIDRNEYAQFRTATDDAFKQFRNGKAATPFRPSAGAM